MQSPITESASLRSRAVWLYYSRNWTQKDIAERLGVSRSTVIRMLEEARRRDEVQVWINSLPGDLTDIALDLEQRFGLPRVIVVPGAESQDETARAVGVALGQYLSGTIEDGMTIGVGWGRTLNAALPTFRPGPREGTRIVSLLGGLIQTRGLNPADFSWQFATRLGGEAMLYLAPLIVDSAETRRRLVEDCGLGLLHETARRLDLVILSCGNLEVPGGSMGSDHLGPEARAMLIAAGAVGDVCCNFLDADGRDVDHPLRGRLMRVELDDLAGAGRIVLAAGGAARAGVIRATIRRIRCSTLVTDEGAARALLAL